MRTRSRTFLMRGGVTLVELLVVMTVVGILVSLLFPAIQQVREASRKVTCGNNLRQIGLAAVHYESQFRAFPVGCTGCRPPSWASATTFHFNRISWNALLLPYLEQHSVYTEFHYDEPYYARENQPAASRVISTFLCPSTVTTKRSGPTTGDRNRNGRWDPGDNLAYTDYGGLFGVSYDLPRIRPEHEGVMLYDRAVSATDVRDGLSNTAMVGECTGRDHTYQSEWANGFNVFDQRFNNPVNRSQDNELFSDHPHGCHLAFCDGHVAFLAETLDQQVLIGMLTRSGGEVFSLGK